MSSSHCENGNFYRNEDNIRSVGTEPVLKEEIFLNIKSSCLLIHKYIAVSELLKNSIEFLKKKVNNYYNGGDSIVEVTNIATLNDGDEFLESISPIILSVVNIEEDRLAGSPSVYQPTKDSREPIDRYKNPAQHFVTSILFTAYHKNGSDNNYLEGINKLETVIRCFQEQQVFYVKEKEEVDPSDEDHVKLVLNMKSLNLNEQNQLWAMLGNRYMPSVLYKMRMISIQHHSSEGANVVEKFKIRLWENRPGDLAGLVEETKDITKITN